MCPLTERVEFRPIGTPRWAGPTKRRKQSSQNRSVDTLAHSTYSACVPDHTMLYVDMFSAPFGEGDVVSKKLESDHVRPVGSELRTRLRDRVGGTALTDLYATGTCISQSRSRLPLGRDRESAPERGDITDMSALRRDDKRAWLRLSTVCGPKEGRRHQTSCEPEGSQFSCPTGALQDGRHTPTEGHSTPRGLDDKLTVDLKDAYFSIPASSHDRKFLRFRWQGKMYQFNCLPFGLSSAPWIFTKATKPVVTILRTLGMRIIIYIDDILVMAPSKELAQEHTECLIFLLENLGFTVNRQKSLTDPTQEIEFLGLVADSVLMELRLPGSKIKNIRSDAKALLQMVQPTAREVSRLLGKLTHATHAMRAAPLFFRHLQACLPKSFLWQQLMNIVFFQQVGGASPRLFEWGRS